MNRQAYGIFEATVTKACAKAKKTFERCGFDDAEDMAHDLVVRLYQVRPEIMKDPDWEEVVIASARERVRGMVQVRRAEERAKARGARHLPIEEAAHVKEPATPWHFLIANEIADQAERNGLDCVMMGDTMKDEAEYYGVTKQRAHQITDEKRSYMADYLIL